ncbi:MAG: hypothetical protein AAF799_41385 [Myxococcota bacterium]
MKTKISAGMRWGWLGGLACGVALAFSCAGTDEFRCSSDSECLGDVSDGRCESTGYCAFEEDDCPSGYAYGEHASPNLAGQCVPPDALTSTGSTGVAATGSSTSAGDSTGLGSGGESSSSGDSSTGTPTVCGDGMRDETESCDLDDLGGETCESMGLFAGGILRCDGLCEFDIDLCSCGDGLIMSEVEACDPAAPGNGTNTLQCADLVDFDFMTGVVGCNPDCSFDLSDCR